MKGRVWTRLRHIYTPDLTPESFQPSFVIFTRVFLCQSGPENHETSFGLMRRGYLEENHPAPSPSPTDVCTHMKNVKWTNKDKTAFTRSSSRFWDLTLSLRRNEFHAHLDSFGQKLQMKDKETYEKGDL